MEDALLAFIHSVLLVSRKWKTYLFKPIIILTPLTLHIKAQRTDLGPPVFLESE